MINQRGLSEVSPQVKINEEFVYESLDETFYREGQKINLNLFRGFVSIDEPKRRAKDIARKNVNFRTTEELMGEIKTQLEKVLDRRVLIKPSVQYYETLSKEDAAMFALYRIGILQAERDDKTNEDIPIFATLLHERYIKY